MALTILKNKRRYYNNRNHILLGVASDLSNLFIVLLCLKYHEVGSLFSQKNEKKITNATDHLANERTFLAWIRLALPLWALALLL